MFAAAAIALSACHPYIAGGYDPAASIHGPLAQVATAPIATARSTSIAAAAPADSASTSAGDSYSLAIGAGVRAFTVEVGVHAHGLTSGALTIPDANSQQPGMAHYLTASSSLDLHWHWLQWRRFSTDLHAGPAAGLLLDRMSGEKSWAQGFRYGTGVDFRLSPAIVFVDVYRTGLTFSGGPAIGYSDITGITIGLALRE